MDGNCEKNCIFVEIVVLGEKEKKMFLNKEKLGQLDLTSGYPFDQRGLQ